jgi:uncharacterized protein DUF5677
MATAPIHSVTVEVAAACDAIDVALGEFINARKSIAGYGQLESTGEALNLFNLVVRNIEGVLTLAREDLVLLPGAYACARAALETATKAAWMVDADDAFAREIRWLAHVQEEERVYERAAKRSNEDGRDGQAFSERAASLKSFRLAVTSKLPIGSTPLKRNPPMDEMLASLDGEHLYTLYIYLSQFIHGGHTATWLYRQGMGTERKAGEYIDPAHWYLPLRICWLSLIEPGSLVLWRLGLDSRCFMSSARVNQIAFAIECTKGNAGSVPH